MSLPLPSPSDSYAVTPDHEIGVELWNAVFASLHARLSALEALEADYQAVIDAGAAAGVSVIADTLGPQLAAVQAQIAGITTLVEAAEDALALIQSGGVPATNVPVSNFGTGANVQTALDTLRLRTLTAGAGMTGGGNLTANRTFAVDVATAANFRAGAANKILDAAGVLLGLAPVALTDAATIAVDFNAGRNFTVTLGGNRTLGAPSNRKAGQSGVIRIHQDATGGRTLVFNSVWKFPGGAPAVSATASAIDLLSYIVVSTDRIEATLTRDVR